MYHFFEGTKIEITVKKGDFNFNLLGFAREKKGKKQECLSII
jgi:hypothetical protein